MANDALQGAQAQMALKEGTGQLTWSSGATGILFQKETLRKHGTIVQADGIRGTRSHVKERARAGPYAVRGVITLNPTPNNLDLILPWILGADESADSFALAETLQAFGVLVDKVGDIYDYQDMYVDWAMFRGRAHREGEEPNPLELLLGVVGKVEATNEASWPAGVSPGIAAGDQPYIFEEGTLTLQSASRQALQFALLLRNHLDVRWGIGSLTASSITPQDRTIQLQLAAPYITALYGETHPGAGGSLQFTNGDRSLLFTFANLLPPDKTPTVLGKHEVLMDLDRIATMSSTDRELVVTNDNTV